MSDNNAKVVVGKEYTVLDPTGRPLTRNGRHTHQVANTILYKDVDGLRPALLPHGTAAEMASQINNHMMDLGVEEPGFRVAERTVTTVTTEWEAH